MSCVLIITSDRLRCPRQQRHAALPACAWILQILGKKDTQHIIRLQLALMKPGVSDIKIHVDSGGYAIRGHRLHIPIFTHPEVTFDVCPHRYEPDPTHVPAAGEAQRILDIQECFKIPTVEGFAFELNNRCAFGGDCCFMSRRFAV